MRRRLVVAPLFKGASVATALAICPALQAASVEAVFSVENALYGAGYDIGQADGWIDERLRTAIRRYQSEQPSLGETGELDAATLEALGVSAATTQLLNGNDATSRSAAMSALGLDKQGKTTVVRPEPAPRPEPKRQSAAVAEAPDPAAEPAEAIAETAMVANAPAQKPELDPEPESSIQATQAIKVEPQVAREPAPEPARPAPKAVPQKTAPKAEPVVARDTREPDSRSVQMNISSGSGLKNESAETNAPALAEQTLKESVNEPDDQSVAGVTEDETSSLAEAPATDVVEDKTESPGAGSSGSQGNILTRFFDFLFGWMV